MEGVGCIALLTILKSGAGSSRWTQGGRGVPPTATIFELATTGPSLKCRRPSRSSCGFGTGVRSIDFRYRQADIQCGRTSKTARGFAPWHPTGDKPPNPRGKEVKTHGVSVQATRKPVLRRRNRSDPSGDTRSGGASVRCSRNRHVKHGGCNPHTLMQCRHPAQTRNSNSNNPPSIPMHCPTHPANPMHSCGSSQPAPCANGHRCNQS